MTMNDDVRKTKIQGKEKLFLPGVMQLNIPMSDKQISYLNMDP